MRFLSFQEVRLPWVYRSGGILSTRISASHARASRAHRRKMARMRNGKAFEHEARQARLDALAYQVKQIKMKTQ